METKKAGAIAYATLALLTTLVCHAGNPVFTNIYTADPSALVYNDTMYVYTGHDEAASGQNSYVMRDWHVFSSKDMVNWTDHGAALSVGAFSWASADAWAGQCVYRNGKFYWYVPMSHKTISGFAIGVASSTSPTGPFTDARGSALITNNMTTQTSISYDDIDPTVFIDDDGQAYLYWGNTVCKYVKLNADMTSYSGSITTVSLQGFTEAPWLHKRNGTYYLSYAAQFPEYIDYATSSSPTGPWTYRGRINDLVPNCGTNHQAILEFGGQWYFVYHNGALSGGGDYHRSVCIDYLYYNSDGTIQKVIQTTAGVGTNTPGPTAVPTQAPTPPPQSQNPVWSGGPYTLSASYVDLPDGIVNGFYDFTIATWVNLSSVASWSRIFDIGTDTNVNMFLTPMAETGAIRFGITLTGNTGEQRIDGSGSFPAGSWQHVAVTRSGNTGILYVNGSEVARNTAMTLGPADIGNTANNYIGRSQYAEDPYLTGSVDKFYVYNRAISQSEVAGLYASQPGTTAAPTAVPTTAPTATPQAGTRGDVNGSGTVDIVDALLIAQFYVGLNPASFNQAVADANCSGVIDIVDALLLAQFYVGLISSLPC